MLISAQVGRRAMHWRVEATWHVVVDPPSWPASIRSARAIFD